MAGKKKIIIVKKKPVASPAPDTIGKGKTKQKAPKPAVVADVEKMVKANKRPKAKPVQSNVPVKAVQKPGARIDWSIIKTKYVTDPKATHRSLEIEFKVSRSTIAKHAKKEKWAEARQEYVKKTESNAIAAAGEDRETVLEQLNSKHTNMFQGIADKLTTATQKLSMDEWAAKNLESLAKAAKLVMEAERLVNGLPSDVKGLSDPRGDKLGVTIEALHDKAKQVIDANPNS